MYLRYIVLKKIIHIPCNKMESYEAAAIKIGSITLVTWVHTFQFTIG